MKLVSKIAAVFAITFLLTSCGEEPKTSKEIAGDFLTALDEGRWDDAKAISTADSDKVIDEYAALGEEAFLHEDAKLAGCEEDGDKATCTYCCDPDLGNEATITLKKEGENWVVVWEEDPYAL